MKPRILFIGNSQTHNHQVPQMVQSLMQSDGSGRKVFVQSVWMGLLSDDSSKAEAVIKGSKWDAVVLQGAPASSSHRFHYPQDGPIRLANLAAEKGSRVLLFVEWPRRGWDESDFQISVYRETEKAVPHAELVPVCRVWDKVRAETGGLDLWESDGNHANLKGSFLAACTLYRFLLGKEARRL